MEEKKETYQLPLLVLKNSLLLPYLKKKFTVEISSIEAFKLYFSEFPLLSVIDEGLFNALKRSEDKRFLTYGRMVGCRLIEDNRYELEVEGLGTAKVLSLSEAPPLPLGEVRLREEIKEPQESLLFKIERIRKSCKIFLKNNIPVREEKKFWEDSIRTTPQMLSFMAMIHLSLERQEEWIGLESINERVEFLLPHLPPSLKKSSPQVLTLPVR